MNRRSLFLAGAMLVTALPLAAQTGSPPTSRPTTVLDLLSSTGIGSNTFVERATVGNNFEIQSSRILLENSTHPQIRELAQEIIATHTAMSAELRSLPEATTRQPAASNDVMTAKLARLRAFEGDELNRWYVQMQVEENREAATYFQSYAENGEVAALKSFAAKYLPRLRAHLARAEALQAPRAE
ncbi:DUF4142 domain-containing protein [Falsiroseomonas selenitidurans]|uniref:DUF4142 domain-containing protein n=1 Tax=Falsiroseomonas selenitidurans TaxID=2716335 RepID=A0ABX1E7D4_9PROT|nr:DUF4142 domain-containing protein [Falsiroseomonas selenitidurans]NKC33110.1 DUF4142 domain-containing protein [Falsiroseomonas selenitidurans]